MSNLKGDIPEERGGVRRGRMRRKRRTRLD